MLNPNQLLKEGLEQVKAVGIIPGKINPEVVVNKRATRRFGRCSRVRGKYEFEIEINNALLSVDKKKAMNTMVHEILHTCDGCMNHGKLWKHYANVMNKKYGYNISRLGSYESAGLERPAAKYVIECEGCNEQYHRMRKSKIVTHAHLYGCGKCGGKLRLKKWRFGYIN